MAQPAVKPEVLSRLLLVQQTLGVMADDRGVAAFLRRALGGIPGVADVHLCVGGEVFPPCDEFDETCSKCDVPWDASDTDSECTAGDANTIHIPLRTAHRRQGCLILSLGDGKAFASYREFMQNVANVVAAAIETRQRIAKLDDARASLEDQVSDRSSRLQESEEKSRALVEAISDLIWEVDVNGTYTYVSPQVEALLGYRPEEIVGRTPFDLMPPEEARRVKGEFLAAVQTLKPLLRVTSTFLYKDGHLVVMETSGVPMLDSLGNFVGYRGIDRDITERQRAEESLRASELKYRTLFEDSFDGLFVTSPAGKILDMNRKGVALFGYDSKEEVLRLDLSRDVYAHPPDRARILAMVHAQGAAEYEVDVKKKSGEVITTYCSLTAVPDHSGEVTSYRGIIRDITERKRVEAERARLVAAVEQSTDSILITDTKGIIEYVNPAFERASGYTAAEVLGQTPRILKSGRHTPAFYRALWSALAAGLPWVTEFVNRRKDGTLFREEAMISPVRDEQGRVTCYVSVNHDVTRQRAAETRAIAVSRERTLIADAIGRLTAQGTPEETAQVICQQVSALTGLSMSGICIFQIDGRAMPMGIVMADGQLVSLRVLPHRRSQYLRERVEAGPWVERWVNRPWHPYNRAWIDAGIDEMAFAPLHHDGVPIGFLMAGKQPSPGLPLGEELPALVEFAALAGASLGPVVAERTDVARVRARLSALITERAFGPVYQPIVDAKHRRIVGYEALTRFDNGTPPDLVLAEATQVGLGMELERAMLEAALEGAQRLPHWVWLQVNASPGFILAGEPLRTIVAGVHRHVVLEVTEHAAIDDYSAFRDAVAAIGPRFPLAIDDAGAGFSSLRHILELRPTFVKLDRSLVEGIDKDATRRAMVTGLLHFTHAEGCRLIAEGVETEAELRALASLGVRLIQGFLTGRPGPLPY